MMEIPPINTAKELLEFVTPSKKYWIGQSYLFRAQYEPDEEGYKLIPSLFRDPREGSLLAKNLREAGSYFGGGRKEDFIFYNRLPNESVLKDSVVLRAAEKLLLKKFVAGSNKIGIHVPESENILNWTLEVRDFLYNAEYKEIEKCEHAKFGELLDDRSYYINQLYKQGSRPPLYTGLAQHHGCPTRLLDFSYNPYKALFHTLHENNPRDSGFISLYFIPEYVFSSAVIGNHINRYHPKQLSSIYQLIKMPTSHNHYLYQQEGLFAYPLTPYHHRINTGAYPSVNSFADLMKPESVKSSPLLKVSIPISESENLGILLGRHNISLSTMMPNLDNVVKDMK